MSFLSFGTNPKHRPGPRPPFGHSWVPKAGSSWVAWATRKGEQGKCEVTGSLDHTRGLILDSQLINWSSIGPNGNMPVELINAAASGEYPCRMGREGHRPASGTRNWLPISLGKIDILYSRGAVVMLWALHLHVRLCFCIGDAPEMHAFEARVKEPEASTTLVAASGRIEASSAYTSDCVLRGYGFIAASSPSHLPIDKAVTLSSVAIASRVATKAGRRGERERVPE